MTMLSALIGQNVPKWEAGTTYPLDAVAWSPANKMPYVRIVAGAGTTDPSEDTTNWALFGASKIKSIQRGTVQVTGTSNTGTATITEVDTEKAEMRLLGVQVSNNVTVEQYAVRISLTNSTTITARRQGITTNTMTASFEITEWW